MITVLVRVKHGPEALAVTLSALVPAVAAGLVGDAVILADAHDEAIDAVADAAGAALVVKDGASWKEGAGNARHEWLLCLDDGDVPQEGWIRVLERFVGLGAPQGGLGRLRRRHGGVLSAGRDLLHAVFHRRSIRAGDLAHRRVFLDGVKIASPVRLSAVIERDPVFS